MMAVLGAAALEQGDRPLSTSRLRTYMGAKAAAEPCGFAFDSRRGPWQSAADFDALRGDPMSTKAERGTKRTCQNPECGSRFYDLNRDPVVCPICQTAYRIEAAPVMPLRAAAAEAALSASRPRSPCTLSRKPSPKMRPRLMRMTHSRLSKAMWNRWLPRKTRRSSRPRRKTAPICPTSSADRWREGRAAIGACRTCPRSSPPGHHRLPLEKGRLTLHATCAIIRTGILKPVRRQTPGFPRHRGRSSVGRAREWHSRGQRFDPARLHQQNQGLRPEFKIS